MRDETRERLPVVGQQRQSAEAERGVVEHRVGRSRRRPGRVEDFLAATLVNAQASLVRARDALIDARYAIAAGVIESKVQLTII